MREFEFKWLHLSDLHVGMTAQGGLWPSLKGALYEDLKRLFDKVGAWDVVIFSGDLTQQGSQVEFDRLDTILDELWARFSDWGFEPLLIPVPGNHDLQRLPPKEPEAIVLNKWWDERSVHEDFFSPESSKLFKEVQKSFGRFEKWQKSRLKRQGYTVISGILPGDISTVFSVAGARVGIVGLNSSWLQVGAGCDALRGCARGEARHPYASAGWMAGTSPGHDGWGGCANLLDNRLFVHVLYQYARTLAALPL